MTKRLANVLWTWWLTWCTMTAWTSPAVVRVISDSSSPSAHRRLRTSALRRVEPHGQSPWPLHVRPDGGDIPPTRMFLLHRAAHGRRPWRNGGVGFWWLMSGLLFASVPILHAAPTGAQPSRNEELVEERSLTGDVVTVTKQAVSIEYSSTQNSAMEMLLPFNEKTEVQGPKKLTELKPGDRVSVRYLQTYRLEDTGERTVLKTVASKVALVRSAVGEGTLRSADQPTSE